MFDDVDIGSNFDTGGGYSIEGGYDPGIGFDNSDLGQYLGQEGTLVSPEWGSSERLYEDFSNAGPLSQPQAQPQQEQGSTGYNTKGLGAYGDSKEPSTLSSVEKQNPILKALGMTATKDGTATDFTDPKSLTSLIKMLGVGGNFLSQLLNKGKQQNAQTPTQLAATLPANPHNNWTPTQQQWANQFFNTPYVTGANRAKQYAADMQSPIVAGRGYAGGGGIGYPGDSRYGAAPSRDPRFSDGPTDIFSRTRDSRERDAGLSGSVQQLQQGSVPRSSADLSVGQIIQMLPSLMKLMGGRDDYAEGGDVEDESMDQGPLGLVATDGMGQADDVPVNLSGGEYVFDADVVAALGDGNNEAGAKKLDELREAIRKRNRSAPTDKIPPPARDPAEQLGLGGV